MVDECHIDINSEIEILKKTFDKKDAEKLENYPIEFLKVRNQIIMILTFQHESSARDCFREIKNNKLLFKGSGIKMEQIVKDVLTGKIRNRIRILNCPHCKSVLVPVMPLDDTDDDYFNYQCFECDVIWDIKLNLHGFKGETKMKCPECGNTAFGKNDVDDVVAKCPKCGAFVGVQYGY